MIISHISLYFIRKIIDKKTLERLMAQPKAALVSVAWES